MKTHYLNQCWLPAMATYGRGNKPQWVLWCQYLCQIYVHLLLLFCHALWWRVMPCQFIISCIFHSLLIGFAELPAEERAAQSWRGYFYACLILGYSLISLLCEKQFVHYVLIFGMQVRSCLMAAVYKKVSFHVKLSENYFDSWGMRGYEDQSAVPTLSAKKLSPNSI